MRNDMHEFPAATRSTLPRTASARSLPASAVDAALDDPSAMIRPAAARRDLNSGDEARMAMDEPHAGSSARDSEGSLLRQLSRQLALLEVQQQQLRQLLDLTEQRYSRDARSY
jgi:hypothetical protein